MPWCGKHVDANGKTPYVYAKTKAEVLTSLLCELVNPRHTLYCLLPTLVAVVGLAVYLCSPATVPVPYLPDGFAFYHNFVSAFPGLT